MSNNLQYGRGCVLKQYTAALNTDFGMNLFRKKAGDKADQILAELGTYQRGKRKGTQKGFLVWLKVVEGGFDYVGGRGVLRGGSIEYRVAKEYCTEHHLCEYHLDSQPTRLQASEIKHATQRIEFCNQEIESTNNLIAKGATKEAIDMLKESYSKDLSDKTLSTVWEAQLKLRIADLKEELKMQENILSINTPK
ncbi:hypothetical protein VCHA53O466_40437 [Vibrio chagasii]|nr:hypothetical protein VCHA53O466_40437 [Vibrio chagasii]